MESISSLSTVLSQNDVTLNVGMQIQKLAISQSEIQGEAVQELIAAAEVVQDPALGRHVDLLA